MKNRKIFLIIILIIIICLILFIFLNLYKKPYVYIIEGGEPYNFYSKSDNFNYLNSLKIFWKENPLYLRDENNKITCNDASLTYNLKEDDNFFYYYCGEYFTVSPIGINPSIGPIEYGPFYDGNLTLDDCTGDSKDNCLFVLALQEDNINYCEGIEPEYLKERCFIVFAEKNNDLKICKKLNGSWGRYEDSKYYCYDILTYINRENNTLNLDFCDKIDYLRSKNDCYYSLSRHNNDITICNLIKDPIRMQSCISTMLKWSDNRSEIIGFTEDTCKLITNPESRESCFKVLKDDCEWYCYPGSDCRRLAHCKD